MTVAALRRCAAACSIAGKDRRWGRHRIAECAAALRADGCAPALADRLAQAAARVGEAVRDAARRLPA